VGLFVMLLGVVLLFVMLLGVVVGVMAVVARAATRAA